MTCTSFCLKIFRTKAITLANLQNKASNTSILNVVNHLNALVQRFSGSKHFPFPLDIRTTVVLVYQYIDHSFYKASKYEDAINLFYNS